jgi:stage IV sporulation protein FB
MHASGWVVVAFCCAIGVRLSGLWHGLALGALIVVSLLLHEAGHMLVATVLGVPVREFGLCLGGAYNRRGTARRRREELLIASAGPLVNLCLVGSLILPLIGPQLAFCNLVLCVMNLLPLPSSDGLRILRALFVSSPAAAMVPAMSEPGSAQ